MIRLHKMALLLSSAAVGAAAFAQPGAGDMRTLPQGWTDTERKGWYEVSQGSRLIPLTWFQALERHDSTVRFLADSNIERYRYLPYNGRGIGLPIGFAVDNRAKDKKLPRTGLHWYRKQNKVPAEPWVGFNCSACHTTEMTYGKDRFRVDGGQGLGDFQTFVDELNLALIATRDDQAKFGRFATQVLQGKDNPENRGLLATALGRLIEWQLTHERMNRATLPDGSPLRYGYGRLDAVGYIFNKVALFTGAASPHGNSPTAPVSYPFLWNTHQHKRVQWNGIASNDPIKARYKGGFVDLGALGRNTGEVIGVFAEVVPKPPSGLLSLLLRSPRFKSSIKFEELNAIEVQLARLLPPRWSDTPFDPPKPELVERGRVVFHEEARCVDCHHVLPRDDLTNPAKEQVMLFRGGVPGNSPPGTDIWMACNSYTFTAASGVFEGSKITQTVDGVKTKRKLGPEEPVAVLIGQVVRASLFGDIPALARILGTFFRPPPPLDEFAAEAVESDEQRRQRCMTEDNKSLGYKARPLSAIWASPPYLHNGSVPTLYDILLPPADRPRRFWVGTKEFDPKKVGYVTTKSEENDFEVIAVGADGQPIRGNGNQGHDYGNAGIKEADRWALIAYMKTL